MSNPEPRCRVQARLLHTPARTWLLASMLAWWVFIRLLRPFLPVQRLVELAIPPLSGPRRAQNAKSPKSIPASCNKNAANELSCIGMLDHSGLWRRHGDCLPRALVCLRFLADHPADPTLLIGFNGSQGHAWVELSGQPLNESRASLALYRPVLILKPAKRKLDKIIVEKQSY